MVRGFNIIVASIALATLLFAQVPTGTIAGTVSDPSGAIVPNCPVTITSSATGMTRTVHSGSTGAFSVSSLPAGTYSVSAELTGFKKLVRNAEIAAGSTTTVDMELQVGATGESVTVSDATSQVNYESHTVEGVVSRDQIQALPLNGRSFLQLAFLSPGVGVSANTGASLNDQFSVSVLGGDSTQTQITIDGVNVMDPVDGGTQQNFSQEMVHEFQISTINTDVSTGLGGFGAINIVSRTGSNDFHGSGYFYYRDHRMAAYPALRRDPANPDPYFARRQSGFYVGGPAVKNRLFFFTNLEHNSQSSVVTIQPADPAFSHFGVIAPSPLTGTQVSNRFDYLINDRHSLFARYSHDANKGFGPRGGASMPSNWLTNRNWADQGVISLSSSLRPSLINDLRVAYTYWSNRNLRATESDCPGCLGLGGPEIDISGAGFTIGNQPNGGQGRNVRHYILTDSLSWQKGSHRMRFGVNWDKEVGPGFYDFEDPGSLSLYSPKSVRDYNASVPASERILVPDSFNTLEDILTLPLRGFNIGIGDPSQPPPFQRDKVLSNYRIHLFAHDTWHATRNLSLNFGLGYTYESNLLNYDIPKPEYLEPLVGQKGIGETPHQTLNFSPTFGFAWTPGKDSSTVIRGGFGMYYGTAVIWKRLEERSYIGPMGNGRLPLPGDIVPNPIPGIPGVPQGTPLSFRSSPTEFRGAYLMQIFPLVQDALAQTIASFGAPNSLSVRTLNVFKTGDELLPTDYRVPQTQHFNLGIQRQLRQDFVVTADFVWRHSLYLDMGNIDYNRWNRASGPVIRPCESAEEQFDPTAKCSAGEINFRTTAGRARYAALLVRADKRFSNRYQLLLSYALQSDVGHHGVIDYDDWNASWGPNQGRHALNASGIVDLPFGTQASFITTFASKGPFTPSISGVDLKGGGVDSQILPGTHPGEFNMGLGKSDLRRLVDQFNQTYAGTVTPRGQRVPTLVLPANFNFGRNFFSQDLRVSKFFKYRERWNLSIFGEVFNLFNYANLGGYSGNLRETASFGQPTARTYQVFGSGGPRAFQLGTRLVF